MNNTQSISDLIYLLLDNEATTYERQSLFKELASQPDLQVEFQEALTAKIALERDVAATYVPSDLEQSLFRKAGIPLLIPPSGWGKLSQFVSGKLFFAAASFITGCVLSFLLFNNTSSNEQPGLASRGTDAYITSQTNKNNNIPHTYSSEIPSESSKKNSSIGRSSSSHHANGRAGQNDGSHSGLTISSSDGNWPGRSITGVHSDDQYSTADTPVFNANINERALISASNKVYSEMIPVEFSYNPISTRGSNSSIVLFPSNLDGMGFIPIEFFRHLSVEFNGLQSLQLFPSRSAGQTGNQFFKNACLSIKYNFNNNHAIGFTGGSEAFPMYVPSGNGLAAKPNMAWFGAFYQYTFDRFWGNFMPFGKAFAGGNDFGSLLKAELGLGWQPDEKVRFVASLDGTQFFYYYKDNWHGAQKLGFKYGLEIFF